MRPKVLLALPLAGALLVGVAGCATVQKTVQKVITPPTKVVHVSIPAKVAAPGAKVTGKLAKGAPSDLPLWPGSTVTKSRVKKSRAGKVWSATFTTTDLYQRVLDGVAKGFENAGWIVEATDASTAEASSTALTVSSSGGAGIVTITSQPDKSTQMAYVVTVQKK